ncbi:EboA domain-containing protein [Algoriphagus mannitolivorans]|uniref:EboA domain-containing protein n=1 Tax=Algoriphagus mannitolivorans TaxID=226504 RepID=UPI00047CE0C4|nr:EboA domain-containing protein [Algoriphagus mannitolivorans]
MQTQNNSNVFLLSLLESRAEAKSLEWLKNQAEKVSQDGAATKFFLAFSQASRFFKKEALALTDSERKAAAELGPGFDPSHWDCLQTARTFILLHFPQEKDSWFKAINQLFETGDYHEQQALYAALPLMPFQDDLLSRAIDGCRTNMTVIFDAIALNNPYPKERFPEANWNQMVLKSIFMQRPIYRIQGLDDRRNQALAEIASDFAHERWAAGRPVMPELWRLVVPFVNENLLEDLKKVVFSENQLEAEAGVMAIYQCSYQPAKNLLQSFPELVSAIEYGEITWEKIGKDFESQKA